MKSINLILLIILLLMSGCGGNKQSTGGVITIDVTKNYPKKDLILQDFMDVEYIALETNDEFVNQGIVQEVGKDYIFVVNRANDGDIFIYDRNGKGLRKINRWGQGSEEYLGYKEFVLDGDKIFINDVMKKKILVYDLFGKFLRSFEHKDSIMYRETYNFDKNNLICFNNLSQNISHRDAQFFIISKHDGSVSNEIQIPFNEKKTVNIPTGPNSMSGYTYNTIFPYNGNWALFEISSDTVFEYSPEHNITPLIARTPSIQSMNPEVFLFINNLTDRYFFIETVKKDKDYPSKKLVYDRQENAVFEYNVYNNDYSFKMEVPMTCQIINNEIAVWYPLQAHQLVDSYKKGELKNGKLKEIASKLNEEDNPVIMLVKHKK